MAKLKQTQKLRIVTWLLAFVMLIASSAFLLTACSGNSDDDDDSDTTTTRTDTQTFANGDFEYFDDSDGTYRIATPENWTSSADSNASGVSASSSVARSGIMDTSFDWSELWADYQEFLTYDEMDDEDIPDDAEYYTDMDDEYDVPGWDLAKAAVENEDDDPADEAIKDASKALNPGTHWADEENAADLDEENGTHVIMLHNYRTNNMGTAARYTSQTITLSAGTAAKVSVWVKTAGLTFNDGNDVDGNRGAFIRITNSVGGTEQDPLIVRNIDTKDVTDNNGWQQFTFFVRASDYATTTFSVVLGLGMQTEGNATSYYEYVQGYAFFDDLEYEVMTGAQYDEQTADVTNKFTLDLSYGSDWMKVDASAGSEYALDLNAVTTTKLSLGTDVTLSAPTDTEDARGNTVESYFPNGSTLTGNRAQDLAKSGVKNASYLTAANGYTQAFLDGFAKFLNTEESTYPLPFAGEDVLVLYSSLGAPYTAKMEAAENSDVFTLAEGEYMFFSFWMKTSELQGGTGATVTLVEGENETVIGAVDTSTLATTDLVDDSKKINSDNYADIFDGWQRCFFFVSNTTEETQSFSLEFSFGPTTISGTTISSYTPGYAAFTGFSYAKVSEEEFSVKTTGSYAVEVSLTGGEDEATSSFDEVSYTDPDKIETDLANLRNYTGVFGGSTYVGGEMLENSEADTENGIDRNDVNQLKTAGLLNRDYLENYTDDLAWVNVITADVLTSDLWTSIFGSACTQPLLIANTVEQSYGFFANSASTIASSSYSVVAVRVVLSPNATANVYLIDTAAADFGEKNYTSSLNYGTGVSYRYDEDGNVVNVDPEDTAFSPRTNILFYLQDNGLWSTTRQHADGADYYANLANYDKDEDGNLIDSSDNIVFYASETDGLYYRYYDEETEEYSVPVRDFTAAGVDITGAVLQKASEQQALSQTVTNDSDSVKTVYVRFFIATGNRSKNYRLEVWSGSRDGETTNAANTFVAFDIVNYGSITADNFSSIVSERMEDYALAANYADADALIEAYEEDPSSFMNGGDGRKLILYRYSLYDDNDYVPYDADNAEEDSTDPYADYDGTTYENEVTYMLFNNDNAENTGRVYYDTIVNFSVSEKSVATSSSGSDTTDDDEDTGSTYNVALLASSIVLAVVLILTLLILLVRKLIANLRSRKPAAVKPTYDNKRKRYIRKLRLEEAERDESADDVLPDEDEISEEDIYKVEEDAEKEAEEASPAEEQAGAAPETADDKDASDENK